MSGFFSFSFARKRAVPRICLGELLDLLMSPHLTAPWDMRHRAVAVIAMTLVRRNGLTKTS